MRNQLIPDAVKQRFPVAFLVEYKGKISGSCGFFVFSAGVAADSQRRRYNSYLVIFCFVENFSLSNTYI
jgi:hypothetical protein